MASAALAVAAAGVVAVGLSFQRHPPASAVVAGERQVTASAGSARDSSPTSSAKFGRTLRWSPPTSLTIPAIRVAAHGIVRLGREADGSLEVPANFDRVGWYQLGPSPGQLGVAIIAGHVDSYTGPAVFWRLGQLHRGESIRVDRRDGSALTFTVYSVAQYPKDRFPTVAIYGNAANRAELRLITCGGPFDAATGHYRDNTVVFARLASVRR